MKIHKNKLEEITESPETQELSSSPTKHDCHVTTYVTKIDNKHYMFDLEYSYNNGLQLWGDEIELTEVEPVEKTVIEWKAVNNVSQRL